MTRARALIAVAAALVLSAVTASSAAAHVTVNPREAEKGGFAKLVFRMPNERDNASTVKLEVAFPENQPLAFVSVRPQQGWSYQVNRAPLPEPVEIEGTQITEAVRTIVWTAQPGFELKPGTFDEFEVSAGFLPKDDQMVFKAIQTYSGGEVVRWIEEAAPGATEEPQRPAPVLTLTEPAEEVAAVAEKKEDDQNRNVTLAMVLSIVALLLGTAGLVLGLLTRRRGGVSAG